MWTCKVPRCDRTSSRVSSTLSSDYRVSLLKVNCHRDGSVDQLRLEEAQVIHVQFTGASFNRIFVLCLQFYWCTANFSFLV